MKLLLLVLQLYFFQQLFYFIIERESINTCHETRSNIFAKTDLSRLVRIWTRIILKKLAEFVIKSGP